MKLLKQLGLLDVFCIASGAMMSSGLFVLPGMAHAVAGPAVVFSYLLAGMLAMTGMLSEAELISAMPKSGGSYFYVTRSMGPAVGTVNGLLTWLSLCLKSSFALVGMSVFARMALGSWLDGVGEAVVGVILCAAFTGLNLIGVKEASKLQIALVAGLLLLLSVYIVEGAFHIDFDYLKPFLKPGGGMKPVLAAAGMVFVSYGGLLATSSVAEEVKDPGRNIPRGMVLSLLVIGFAYLAAVFVTSGVMGAEKLDVSRAPISDGAEIFMGRPGFIALSVAAMLAFISTANAGVMSASRFPLAMGRDKLLPSRLTRINARFKTPHLAILTTGAAIAAPLFLPLDFLVKAASTVIIMTFIFSCLCVVVMRESGIQNYRPGFKAPFYPWLQIIGFIGFVLLMSQMGISALSLAGTLVIGALAVYWFYGRIKANREYALMHIVAKVTDKRISERLLESELREIVRERDSLIKDRFDHLVEDSPVLDFSDPMNLEEFFSAAADELSPRLKMSAEDLRRQLFEREADTSTAISPTLAIPHLIIDGEDCFQLLIARCRGGVKFNEQAQDVNAIFVLAGTRNERNFHLQVLSAIAQIASDKQFSEQWRNAKTIEDLRDVILLGERKRYATETFEE